MSNPTLIAPTSCNALQETHTQILLALTRAPWSSLYQLADMLQSTCDAMQERLDECEAAGWVKVIEQGLTHFPKKLYAPTQIGVTRLAQWLNVPESVLLHQLSFPAFRYSSLRSGLPIAREVAQFCAGFMRACRAHNEEFLWEAFIQRRYKGVELLIHARLNLNQNDEWRVLYLLVDNGGGPVWMWWRHLRYFDLWARRNPDSIPPLLILSFTQTRAWSLLALGQQLCSSVQVLACADRDAALGPNPLQARWWTFEDDDIVLANPLAASVPAQDAHRVWPMPILLKRMHAKRNQRDLAPPNIELAELESITNTEVLSALESLNNIEIQVFDFICLHSACPASAMVCFLDLSNGVVGDALSKLIALNLVTAFDYTPPIRKLRTNHTPLTTTMYSATEVTAHAWWQRQACPGAVAFARRYVRGATDHLRRAAHTLAVFGFFEQLHTQASGWSRVHRKVDAPPDDVNEGELPSIELEAFDDDLNSTANYMLDGNPSRWSPDGYGVLRSGTTRVRFWLEIDGSAGGPAHTSAEVWERKLGSLCGYLASDKWMLNFPDFPQLLIVTQDLRIAPLVGDTLLKAATSFRVDVPRVFVASAAAVAQQGPLGKVWRAAHDAREAGLTHAFPPMVSISSDEGA